MKTLAFLLFFLSLSASALDATYLNEGSVDLSRVPAPPEIGSSADLNDLEVLLAHQRTRTDMDCERASFEEPGYAESFFGGAYGPLSDSEAKELHDFHEVLHQEAKLFYRVLKRKYARPRPYERSALVGPCIPLSSSKSGSYPSGHAASAILSSLVYAEIYPEKRQEFLIRGEVIADGRLIGGVHYPSDVRWGKFIGRLVFEALMKNERFKADLAKLRP